MELDVVPANHYLRFRTMFPETEIVDVSPLIRQVRMVESEYEIGELRESAAMSDRMFAEVPELLEPGITSLPWRHGLKATTAAWVTRALFGWEL